MKDFRAFLNSKSSLGPSIPRYLELDDNETERFQYHISKCIDALKSKKEEYRLLLNESIPLEEQEDQILIMNDKIKHLRSLKLEKEQIRREILIREVKNDAINIEKHKELKKKLNEYNMIIKCYSDYFNMHLEVISCTDEQCKISVHFIKKCRTPFVFTVSMDKVIQVEGARLKSPIIFKEITIHEFLKQLFNS